MSFGQAEVILTSVLVGLHSIGLLTNSTLLVASLRVDKINFNQRFLYVGITVCALLHTFAAAPILIHNLVHLGWSNDLLCNAHGWLSSFFPFLTGALVCYLAIFQYDIIVQSNHWSRRRLYARTLFSVVLSSIISSSAFYTTNRFRIRPSGVWCGFDYTMRADSGITAGLLATLGLLYVTVRLAHAYLGIFRTLAKHVQSSEKHAHRGHTRTASTQFQSMKTSMTLHMSLIELQNPLSGIGEVEVTSPTSPRATGSLCTSNRVTPLDAVRTLKLQEHNYQHWTIKQSRINRRIFSISLCYFCTLAPWIYSVMSGLFAGAELSYGVDVGCVIGVASFQTILPVVLILSTDALWRKVSVSPVHLRNASIRSSIADI